jgi:hypothetical protein
MQCILLHCDTATLEVHKYLVTSCASVSSVCIIYSDPSFDRVLMLIESAEKLACALLLDVHFPDS